MAIGIDFILRASTAGFTRGIAAANNSIHDLKKSLKVGDVGNGIKQWLGAGAVIAGMRAIINHADEVRESLEKIGKPIPMSIASVARLGDGFKDLKNGVASLGVEILSIFTKLGDAAGQAFNRAWNGTKGTINADIGAKIEREADASVAASEASIAKMRATGVDDVRAAEQKLADIKRKNALAAMNDAEKLAFLRKEEIALAKELRKREGANDGSAWNQMKVDSAASDLESKRGEIAEAQRKANKDNQDNLMALGKAIDAQEKAKAALRDQRQDPFLPTLEGLAGSQKFGENDAKSIAIEKARQVLRLEEQARFAGGRGDLAGAVDLQSRADKIRAGLGNFAKSDDVNKGKDVSDAVDKTTKAVEDNTATLKSIFVVGSK